MSCSSIVVFEVNDALKSTMPSCATSPTCCLWLTGPLLTGSETARGSLSYHKAAASCEVACRSISRARLRTLEANKLVSGCVHNDEQKLAITAVLPANSTFAA